MTSAEREQRIEALQEAITRDHTKLEDFITGPEEKSALQSHPEVRAIAARLDLNRAALLELQAGR